MQGGVLYCVIIGGAFFLAGVFSAGMVFWMYVADRWKKRNDPNAPGFLELDRRGRSPQGTEHKETHRQEKSEQ